MISGAKVQVVVAYFGESLSRGRDQFGGCDSMKIGRRTGPQNIPSTEEATESGHEKIKSLPKIVGFGPFIRAKNKIAGVWKSRNQDVCQKCIVSDVR